ncbi:hypothetical protein [Chloroflexus aggregans]|uniref:Uncharacterized protein n=1 Tax=Chloroflexus aggregans (strain MD-66 / DSM 9485) TaxID=326427 RepID=B8GBE0_CHLAD|nr:hypothetical protein [Chloroflexus aggregans]ACL24768.1 hypothetical protein Cagg_1873 [Chloroflexus aggregans DSM 9485]
MGRPTSPSPYVKPLPVLGLPIPWWKVKRSAMNTNEPPAWQRQVQAIVEIQLARFPVLIQLRATWRLLREERPDWPWLLPVLAIIFARTYRQERARLRRL